MLFVFLFLLFMLQLSAAEEIKLRFSGPDDFEKLTEENKKLTVKLFYQGKEEAYLYLPAGWDADNLRIWFSGTDWMEYENVRYKNGDRISFPLNEPGDFSIGDSGKTYRLTVMQSKSIPALFVCTDSNSMKHIHAQKGNREEAFLTIYNPDGKKAFSDRIKHIKSRGNSTFDAPKKPYQIKFNKKISLFGWNAEKTYVLLANYIDKSQIRNKLALDLARYSGAYRFVPQTQPVDLYLNGGYNGTYLLTEKVEINTGRLDTYDLEEEIEDLNAELEWEMLNCEGDDKYRRNAKKYYHIPNAPSEYTGGYLIVETISSYYNNTPSGFVTRRGQAFIIKEPKYVTKEGIVLTAKDLLFLGHFLIITETRRFSRTGRISLSRLYTYFSARQCYFFKKFISFYKKNTCLRTRQALK